MQKLLAHTTKKKDGRPFQSTGLTAGISQGLPSACLESRQIGMFGHSQVAKRRGHNFSSCLYQPPSSKPSKSTGPYCQQLSVCEFHASGSGNSVLLQCCVFALEATASAHLHRWSRRCHSSSQHFCRVLSISSSFWEQTDSSEVD